MTCLNTDRHSLPFSHAKPRASSPKKLVHEVKGAFFNVVAEHRNSKNSSETYRPSYHDGGVDTINW